MTQSPQRVAGRAAASGAGTAPAATQHLTPGHTRRAQRFAGLLSQAAAGPADAGQLTAKPGDLPSPIGWQDSGAAEANANTSLATEPAATSVDDTAGDGAQSADAAGGHGLPPAATPRSDTPGPRHRGPADDAIEPLDEAATLQALVDTLTRWFRLFRHRDDPSWRVCFSVAPHILADTDIEVHSEPARVRVTLQCGDAASRQRIVAHLPALEAGLRHCAAVPAQVLLRGK